MQTQKYCIFCCGTGWVKSTASDGGYDCKVCDGKGYVKERPTFEELLGESQPDRTKLILGNCLTCNGKGYHGPSEYMAMVCCSDCGGLGVVDVVDPERRREEMAKETVNHPKHYNMGKFEVIDVIEDWKLGFNDGNAVKYIGRHRHKNNPKEDLKKALWYVARELVTAHNLSITELTMMLTTIKKEQKTN